MKHSGWIKAAVPVMAMAILVAACGDDDNAAEVDAGGAIEMATRDGVDSTADGATAGDAVSTWGDVDTAVIRIETRGGLFDPDAADLDVAIAGSGTGFFIDESGLAVTNNHVVGGAATLEVYVNGETSPHNARVIGASECSDLAVIDVDGDDYPFLDWAKSAPAVPDEVYAVGFPLGDPEVTVTDGVVSKESSNGSSPFSSVDFEFEHTAFLAPGNSGGPLVTPKGLVVGVNYQLTEAGQFSAIAASGAGDIVESLRAGTNVEWLGLNSVAVEDLGILVLGVETDSPAGRAGIEPGDVLLELEDLPVGVDGTKDSYCDVLRSRAMEQPLRVEVLRIDDSIDELTLEPGN